jgi:hypothetical protein
MGPTIGVFSVRRGGEGVRSLVEKQILDLQERE